jgi:thioredoxin 2
MERYNSLMAAFTLDDRGIVVVCASCGKHNRLAYERLGDPVRCGSCKTPLPPPAAPIDVGTAADFDRLVTRASVPIVVDYWAPWCGPCRMMAPELAKVAARAAGRFLVVKVTTEALPDLGQRFGIQSIPTLGVFAAGREVARTSGARPAADIEAFVAQAAEPLHERHKG